MVLFHTPPDPNVVRSLKSPSRVCVRTRTKSEIKFFHNISDLMRNTLVLVIFLCSLTLVHAGTVYIPIADGRPFGHNDENGTNAAAVVNKWEKSNPEKKIVSVSMSQSGGGSIMGVWVTYTSPDPATNKSVVSVNGQESPKTDTINPAIQVKAGLKTVYVANPDSDLGNRARITLILNKWSKENPDARIVCWVPDKASFFAGNRKSHEYYGVWITYQ